jgi:hypothetical protein
LDDDPLTSPSFPAINTSDSRSYRARRSSGAHSAPQTGPQPVTGRSGGFAEPTTQYPVQAHTAQPQIPPPAPVANPYGSYVSASQPVYRDAAQSRPDVLPYGAGYGNGQQPEPAWYSGPATGYLPTNGYGTGEHPASGHNGNGHNGNGYAARAQHDIPGGYGPVDYQNLNDQSADYQPAPSMTGGYAPQNQRPGQFDERGYAAPDPAYGQDGYQGYSGYGPGGR